MAWLLILAGLVTLVVGAEALVRGSAWIAEAMGIRPMVVGLTVVAIGTSAPELVVSVIAANKGDTALVIGNIFGSNTANLALILGVTAILRPIDASGSRMRFELLWLLAASLLTFSAFVGEVHEFSRQLGIFMVVMIILFMVLLVVRERRDRPKRSSVARHDRTTKEAAMYLAITAAGGIGLFYGGKWLVNGATEIAVALKISSAVIGATVIAISTSLPELAASIVAARRGQPEMAIGNVVGSNIFNILMVLGITATISPIPASWADHGVRMLVPMVLTVFVAFLLLGKRRISKRTGSILLISYVSYIIWELQ